MMLYTLSKSLVAVCTYCDMADGDYVTVECVEEVVKIYDFWKVNEDNEIVFDPGSGDDVDYLSRTWTWTCRMCGHLLKLAHGVEGRLD